MIKSSKIYISLLIVLFSIQTNFAQKLGYIDSNEILELMEEYQEATIAFRKQVEEWQKEINYKRDSIFAYITSYIDYFDDAVAAEDAKKIAKKQEDLKVLEERVFGYEGLLFQKQEALMKPIREKLNKAIQHVKKREGIEKMVDKVKHEGIINYDESYLNCNTLVLAELGIIKKQ